MRKSDRIYAIAGALLFHLLLLLVFLFTFLTYPQRGEGNGLLNLHMI